MKEGSEASTPEINNNYCRNSPRVSASKLMMTDHYKTDKEEVKTRTRPK